MGVLDDIPNPYSAAKSVGDWAYTTPVGVKTQADWDAEQAARDAATNAENARGGGFFGQLAAGFSGRPNPSGAPATRPLDQPILPPTPTAPGATPVPPPVKPGTPASGGPDRGPVTAAPGDRSDEAAGRDTRNTAWIRDAGRPLVNDEPPANPSYFEPVDQGAAQARLEAGTSPGGGGNGILFGGAGGGNHTVADILGQIQAQDLLSRLSAGRDQDIDATLRREAAFDPTRRRIQSETDQLQLEQLLPVGEDGVNADTWISAWNDDGSGRMIDRDLGPGYRKVGSESRVGSARAAQLSPATQREAVFSNLGKLQLQIMQLNQAAAQGDKTAAAQADELQKHYDAKVSEIKLYMPALLGKVLYPAEKTDEMDALITADAVRREAAAQQQVKK